ILKILDRTGGDAGFHGRSRNRRRNAQDQPRIERARYQRARAEPLRFAAVEAGSERINRWIARAGYERARADPLRFAAVEAGSERINRWIARELGDGIDRGLLHLLIDRGGATIARAGEGDRKAQDVVEDR